MHHQAPKQKLVDHSWLVLKWAKSERLSKAVQAPSSECCPHETHANVNPLSRQQDIQPHLADQTHTHTPGTRKHTTAWTDTAGGTADARASAPKPEPLPQPLALLHRSPGPAVLAAAAAPELVSCVEGWR
eukprot:1134179-Pelagomonas_calceolata.AAC.1